jgi:WD40 repeat protein
VNYTGGLALYIRDGANWRRTGVLAPTASRVAFGFGGGRLFGTTDKDLLVYDVPSGRLLARWPGPGTGNEVGSPSLAVRPDGSQTATGDGTRVGFFNSTTGSLVKLLEPSAPYQVKGLSYAPNSRYIAVAVAFAAHFIETTSFSTVAVLTEHRHSVDGVAVSPDGSMLAAVGGSVVTIWDLIGLNSSASE